MVLVIAPSSLSCKSKLAVSIRSTVVVSLLMLGRNNTPLLLPVSGKNSCLSVDVKPALLSMVLTVLLVGFFGVKLNILFGFSRDCSIRLSSAEPS